MVKRWNHNAFTGTTSKNLTHVLHKANEILHFESRVLDIVNQTWVKKTDLYRLYAVTLHLHREVPNPMNTSAVAGHYVTMICKNGIWYKYDDRKNATQHNPGSINPGALSLDDDDFSSGATPFMYNLNASHAVVAAEQMLQDLIGNVRIPKCRSHLLTRLSMGSDNIVEVVLTRF